MKTKITRRQLLLLLGAVSAGGLSWAAADELANVLPPEAHEAKIKEGLVPLIYSRRYNITAFGFERLHPFDGRKFSKIHESLIKSGLRKEGDFLHPIELSEEQLATIHTPRYLETLHSSLEIAFILELGPLAVLPAPLIDWRVLKPMRFASGGTLLACKHALKHGVAVNLGGGFHHAESDKGGGFCVYSDIPIAIKILHDEGKVKRALIVDTDAHQGNGFANVARSTDYMNGLDLYDESIYPHPKVEEDWAIPFPANTSGDVYLSALEDALPKAISKFQPDLIVYNAGSDVLKSDPLSTLRLSVSDMNERDLFVVAQARARNIPIAMVLAGGYSTESADAHAGSVKAIVEKFDANA